METAIYALLRAQHAMILQPIAYHALQAILSPVQQPVLYAHIPASHVMPLLRLVYRVPLLIIWITIYVNFVQIILPIVLFVQAYSAKSAT